MMEMKNSDQYTINSYMFCSDLSAVHNQSFGVLNRKMGMFNILDGLSDVYNSDQSIWHFLATFRVALTPFVEFLLTGLLEFRICEKARQT